MNDYVKSTGRRAWWMPFILLVMLASGCTWLKHGFQEPKIALVGFSHLPGDGLLEQRFALRLQLTNPNDQRLAIKGLSFSFSIEGFELINGVSGKVPVIEPYGQANFSVQGSAHMLDAVRLFNELRRDPRMRFNYTLDARVDLAEGWPASFNLKREGEINLLEEK